MTRAVYQHRAYEDCLRRLGATAISLPAEPELPDSMFVEDAAVVVDECALITRPGAPSRRPECESIARALAPYRQLHTVEEPGTIDGGDVLRIGRRFFVGISTRTNQEGARQFATFLARYGYNTTLVRVNGCLHLKSAATLAGDRVLVNPEWINPAVFDMPHLAVVEPHAANVLTLGDTVIVPANFPRTAEMLERAGLRIERLDISELQKAESGLTCSSLIFD